MCAACLTAGMYCRENESEYVHVAPSNRCNDDQMIVLFSNEANSGFELISN